MQVRIQASGGLLGWPEPGCRCASCQRARAAGTARGPFSAIVDRVLRVEGPRVVPVAASGEDKGGDKGPAGGWAEGAARELGGYQVRRLPGGWDVSAPDGGRLLCADGSGAAPAVPPGTRRYDVALLDLLGDPAQLGRLRGQGAVTPGTVVAMVFADHRVSSERELRRRGHIWRLEVPRDGDLVRAPAPAGGQRAGGERALPYRVVVLGGARSGKSAEAEMRVAAEPAVTYVATAAAPAPGADPEWAMRIAAHRSRRPPWWRTVETTDLPGVLRQARGTVLVDSVTAWLAAVMDECGAWDGAAAPASRVGERIAELVGVWRQASAYLVAVSDETGLGVVPETPAGRMFRDELGRLNQALAAESEELAVVVAGQATTISGPDFPCGSLRRPLRCRNDTGVRTPPRLARYGR